jgi:tRNA-specific 2-thiouridylase
VAHDVTWGGGPPPARGTRVAVRIRHRHPPIAARIAAADGGGARLDFEAPGPAVTPGQAAVFYAGELVLGGGWIAEGVA